MNTRLGSIFQDHMVLQRDRPLPVWGWCRPGTTATVRLGAAQADAQADRGGRWMAILPPQPAAGPLTLSVHADGAETKLTDVWLGEVWLASGQSNMQMLVSESRDADRETAAATYPGIRVWTTARVAALAPQERAEGCWRVCAPDTAGKFTAVGYYFARELHRELGVAIGIIDSSWGGTIAEAWTSREGLLAEPELRCHAEKIDHFFGPNGQPEREAFEKRKADWLAQIPVDAGNAGERDGWHQSAADETGWRTMNLPRLWRAAGHVTNGVFWFRRAVEIPAAWAGRDLELHVGACDKCDHTYFDGRLLGSLSMKDSPDAWRTPRVYRLPGATVKAGRHVIAVRVFSEIYGGGMTGPVDEMWVAPVGAASGERLPLDGVWRYRIEQDFGCTPPPPALAYGPDNPNTPMALHNAMIAPLAPYALKGFIWYQGESNSSRPTEYRLLFPNMIRDWRRTFGQGELSFYWVQIANYLSRVDAPVESDWAELREAQRLTLDRVAHGGMAVIIDIGDADDIHPKNKQDVGRRLALCALANDYGRADLVGSSPLPVRAIRRDGAVLVRFQPVADGLALSSGTRPEGFELAGADRVFHQAEASIEGRDAVALRADAVAEPRWIRYAWADNPRTNLVGGTGLPASPFETAVPGGDWLSEP
jgi:sialate O-acetylesterase